ncbi:hypothetical protein FB45DRAFT_785136 [Roridomyces roridus]|uniref:Decapping nuclease n=1 Tax=Roridomyces roridus TaxID=1738132 RepID=A0AAD7FSJ9_9AGAR|nr:hypothetical protein FB45DRAFT_785136 [Roridomyces roridus]
MTPEPCRALIMSPSHVPTRRLIDSSDPPQCPLPARLGEPKQVACSSLCGGQLRVDSTAALRYFVYPPAKADLKSGYDQLTYEQRTKTSRGLEDIFAMCIKSKNSEQLLDVQVITWAGIVKRIMLGKKMHLNVSFHNGILYIESHCPPEWYIDIGTSRVLSIRDPQTYWGYNFETLCSSETPQGPSGGTVNLQTHFSVAVVRKIGSLKLLLVGDVDCVKPEYVQNPVPEHYVELKIKTSEPDRFRPVLRDKWEMQSLLLGGRKILVGYTNKAGVLQGVKTLSVRASHSAWRQKKIDWASRVLHSLVEYRAQAQQDEGVLKVWRVELGRQYVDIRELGSAEERALNPWCGARNGILPVRFLKGLRRKLTIPHLASAEARERALNQWRRPRAAK